MPLADKLGGVTKILAKNGKCPSTVHVDRPGCPRGETRKGTGLKASTLTGFATHKYFIHQVTPKSCQIRTMYRCFSIVLLHSRSSARHAHAARVQRDYLLYSLIQVWRPSEQRQNLSEPYAYTFLFEQQKFVFKPMIVMYDAAESPLSSLFSFLHSLGS